MSQKNKSRGTSIKDKYKSLPVNFDFDDLAFIDAGDGELPTNINAINEAQFYLFDKRMGGHLFSFVKKIPVGIRRTYIPR